MDYYTLPTPQGGFTIALYNDNGKITAGVAVCSVHDNYDRKKGAEIAIERLKSQPVLFKFSEPTQLSKKRRLHHLLNNVLQFFECDIVSMGKELNNRYGDHYDYYDMLNCGRGLHLGIVGFGLVWM